MSLQPDTVKNFLFKTWLLDIAEFTVLVYQRSRKLG